MKWTRDSVSSVLGIFDKLIGRLEAIKVSRLDKEVAALEKMVKAQELAAEHRIEIGKAEKAISKLKAFLE
jgi:hypothetical protein